MRRLVKVFKRNGETALYKLLEYLKKNNVCILGLLVGSIFFICVFGIQILNITYTDWLLGGGDITQSFLGWVFFRNSDCFFSHWIDG